jgi:hypothetical protein
MENEMFLGFMMFLTIVIGFRTYKKPEPKPKKDYLTGNALLLQVIFLVIGSLCKSLKDAIWKP